MSDKMPQAVPVSSHGPFTPEPVPGPLTPETTPFEQAVEIVNAVKAGEDPVGSQSQALIDIVTHITIALREAAVPEIDEGEIGRWVVAHGPISGSPVELAREYMEVGVSPDVIPPGALGESGAGRFPATGRPAPTHADVFPGTVPPEDREPA